MKLFEWIKTVYIEPTAELVRTEAKCLHVIGTCGECKYWNKLGQCVCPKGYVDQVPKDFGCIHFEQKELNEKVANDSQFKDNLSPL